MQHWLCTSSTHIPQTIKNCDRNEMSPNETCLEKAVKLPQFQIFVCHWREPLRCLPFKVTRSQGSKKKFCRENCDVLVCLHCLSKFVVRTAYLSRVHIRETIVGVFAKLHARTYCRCFSSKISRPNLNAVSLVHSDSIFSFTPKIGHGMWQHQVCLGRCTSILCANTFLG